MGCPLRPHPPLLTPPTPCCLPALQNLSLEKKKQLSVECSGQGKYVTLASAGNITLCDIYIQARGYRRGDYRGHCLHTIRTSGGTLPRMFASALAIVPPPAPPTPHPP